jgi:hypothetical protein
MIGRVRYLRLSLLIIALAFLLLLPSGVYGQKKKFVENVAGYYDKTDSLPFFMFERAELDTLMWMNAVMPRVEEKIGMECDVNVSFRVTSRKHVCHIRHEKVDIRVPRSFQFRDYQYHDTVKNYFIAETTRLLRLTNGLWYSDTTLSNKEIRMQIRFRNEAYERLNKDATFSNAPANGTPLGQPVSLQSKADLYNYGVQKFASRKTLLARVYFEEYVRYKPDEKDGHFSLGVCYHKLRNAEKACAEWKKCASLGDTAVKYYLTRHCEN